MATWLGKITCTGLTRWSTLLPTTSWGREAECGRRAGAGFGGRHRQDPGGFRSTCATNARSAAAPNRADQALGPCPRGPDARQNWGKFNAHKWGGFTGRSRALLCVRPVLNTRNGVSGNPSSRDCERPARMVRPAEWNCARRGVRVGSTRLNAEHDNLIASPDTSCSATSRRLVAGGRTARSASAVHDGPSGTYHWRRRARRLSARPGLTATLGQGHAFALALTPASSAR